MNTIKTRKGEFDFEDVRKQMNAHLLLTILTDKKERTLQQVFDIYCIDHFEHFSELFYFDKE